MNTKKHIAGFTMLEVLITMVILSIGLLGLAGLQANGLKSNHQAYMRTQATLLAYDMSDRMRANMAGVKAGSYDNISGDVNKPYAAPSKDCEDTAVSCSVTEMATFDSLKWRQAIDDKLPSGQGKTSINNGINTITVMWDDERTGATGTNCGADTSIDLKCFNVELQL